MYRVKYRKKGVTAVTSVPAKTQSEVIRRFKERGYDVINIEKSGWGWSATFGKGFKRKDRLKGF